MSISSIQASEALHETYLSKPKKTSDELSEQKDSGADRVSISEEAFRMAKEAAAEKENSEKDSMSFMEDEGEENKFDEKKPLDLSSINMFKMMMEMLLVAELDKTGDAPTDTSGAETEEQPKQSKTSSPFQDNEKVSALKKVMTDLSTGKANIMDIPQAMAGGSPAGATKPAGKQSTGQSATSNVDNKPV